MNGLMELTLSVGAFAVAAGLTKLEKFLDNKYEVLPALFHAVSESIFQENAIHDGHVRQVYNPVAGGVEVQHWFEFGDEATYQRYDKEARYQTRDVLTNFVKAGRFSFKNAAYMQTPDYQRVNYMQSKIRKEKYKGLYKLIA